MDARQLSPYDRLRKVARYCRLYGPARTWVKVRGQRHLHRIFNRLPPISLPRDGQTVGLIGCGNFAFTNIAWILRRKYGAVIAGCMDSDVHRAASLARAYRAPFYTNDADELLGRPEIRLVCIASNHASHADYAVAALERGKHVFIEKPHVVDAGQLRRLSDAMRRTPGRVFLGFNRPHSPFGRVLSKRLAEQSGPAMFSWFVVGHHLEPNHWYHKPVEGGRVLGNVCHWTDFLLAMTGEPKFPIRIAPSADAGDNADLVVTYHFGDGSRGVIAFSAKGETFEGVRERFSCQKGNLIASLDDFERLRIDVGPTKEIHRNLFRDHGHKRCILRAYRSVMENRPYDREREVAHIVDTAHLFLETKRAVEERRELVIERFEAPAPRTQAAVLSSLGAEADCVHGLADEPLQHPGCLLIAPVLVADASEPATTHASGSRVV